MAQVLKLMKAAGPVAVRVTRPAQVKSASNAAKEFAAALGFTTVEREEIALAVNELGTNLLKHAGEGDILLSPIESRSEEHTSELQSHHDLVCRLLLEKK